MTDAAVPEGHKGLHGLLYGEGGAERHDAGGSYQFRKVRHVRARPQQLLCVLVCCTMG